MSPAQQQSTSSSAAPRTRSSAGAAAAVVDGGARAAHRFPSPSGEASACPAPRLRERPVSAQSPGRAVLARLLEAQAQAHERRKRRRARPGVLPRPRGLVVEAAYWKPPSTMPVSSTDGSRSDRAAVGRQQAILEAQLAAGRPRAPAPGSARTGRRATGSRASNRPIRARRARRGTTCASPDVGSIEIAIGSAPPTWRRSNPAPRAGVRRVGGGPRLFAVALVAPRSVPRSAPCRMRQAQRDHDFKQGESMRGAGRRFHRCRPRRPARARAA